MTDDMSKLQAQLKQLQLERNYFSEQLNVVRFTALTYLHFSFVYHKMIASICLTYFPC